MKIQYYTLSSFAETREGGNLAGVVLHGDVLTEQEMQRAAAAIGFSETAFVMPSKKADYRVRFFTPTDEVDLCGHATVATFHLMSSLDILKNGNYTQETKCGVLGIEIREPHFVMMDQFLPEFSEVMDREMIADTLHIDTTDLISELPVQIVSTGLRDVFVPVKSMDILNAAVPDQEKIKKISEQYQTAGYHVFSLDAPDGANACCRNFAPIYDIPEEAATGTSSGALACYLYHYQQVSAEQAKDLRFKQGYSMQKPSEICAALTVHEKEIERVQVGGTARNTTLCEIEI